MREAGLFVRPGRPGQDYPGIRPACGGAGRTRFPPVGQPHASLPPGEQLGEARKDLAPAHVAAAKAIDRAHQVALGIPR